jgi:aminoglycoside phosphotransferase (APT) family kinase protein
MTLVHHDFRVDNMLFGARPDDLVVIDFQTVGWGVPMFDVAYLMGTSLGPEPRRALERDEIARHADELGEHGVHLEAAAAWDLYRQASVAVLVMLVSASGSVKSSERSLAMYRRLLASGAQMALDLDAAEFIGG